MGIGATIGKAIAGAMHIDSPTAMVDRILPTQMLPSLGTTIGVADAVGRKIPWWVWLVVGVLLVTKGKSAWGWAAKKLTKKE